MVSLLSGGSMDFSIFSGLEPVSQAGIMHNAQLKIYPDGSGKLLCFDRAIIRESGYEERRTVKPEAERAGDSGGDIARAQRRARVAVEDIARSTDFRYFVTLTLNGERIARYDEGEVIRRVGDWLKNRVKRNGLAYVLVPERHKDGAIHFHGLFNSAVAVVDSGTVDYMGKPRKPRSAAQRARWLDDGGHVVYNIPWWGWGFSTAIELYGDRRSAVGYVCKYIAKQQEKIGGRWYYSGGELGRPVVHTMSCDFEVMAEGEPVFSVEGLGCRGCKIEIDGGLSNDMDFSW